MFLLKPNNTKYWLRQFFGTKNRLRNLVSGYVLTTMFFWIKTQASKGICLLKKRNNEVLSLGFAYHFGLNLAIVSANNITEQLRISYCNLFYSQGPNEEYWCILFAMKAIRWDKHFPKEDFSLLRQHMGTSCTMLWPRELFPHLSTITGSDGVSFLFPHDFFSQHRLYSGQNKRLYISIQHHASFKLFCW